MNRSCTFFLLLFVPLFSTGQIINTERLRIFAHEDGFSGSVGFSFRLIQNTRTLLQGGIKGGIEYLHRRHRILTFSNFKISRANNEDLVNDGFLHGRYNFEVTNRLFLEAFSQVQYNTIQKMEYRLLNGGGIRVKLAHNDSLRFYLGTTYMYEVDRFTDSLQTQRYTHRQSNYLSFGYAFSDNMILDLIFYFQPAWDDLQNLRMSTEARFQFNLTERIALQFTYSLLYDTRTVEDLPNLYTDLLTSLNYTF